jgi:hypothetical protein
MLVGYKTWRALAGSYVLVFTSELIKISPHPQHGRVAAKNQQPQCTAQAHDGTTARTNSEAHGK